MRRNGYLSKIWPCHSLRRPRFPIIRVYFHYWMTFAAYIWCLCAQFSFDFVTLTFELLTLAVSDELSFIHPMHLPIFSILRLSVHQLWVPQYDHITITWNGHCACAVSRDLWPGGKIIHIFEILTPIFLFTLLLSGRYTTKSKRKGKEADLYSAYRQYLDH